MKNEPHPSTLLKPEWVKTIRSEAFSAEEAGMLQSKQLELVYEQQWLKMLVPKVYGGLELDLPAQIRSEEALSWADGSLGWVITLCAGACWFGGFVNAEASQQIFTNPKVCLAGSGASSGTAEKVDGGYILNGHWKYASGVKHATHFTANCIIQENSKPVLNPDGNPLVLSFVIDANLAKLVPAWKYIGMMGTGSHAFTLDNVFVPANHAFVISPDTTVVNTPLYRYPFMQLAEATLAANLAGMALHFTDLCGPIFEQEVAESKRMTEDNKVVLMTDFQDTKDNLQSLRNEFYDAVDASWYAGLAEPVIPLEILKRVSRTSRLLAHAAREGVDHLYPYCGLQAAAPDTEINQVWRDLHTASQHALLTFLE